MSGLSYDPDKYPDCPNCESDLFVEKWDTHNGAYRCHFCGWRSDGE